MFFSPASRGVSFFFIIIIVVVVSLDYLSVCVFNAEQL